MRHSSHVSRLTWGAITLGVGLAGFFDGIVLHQVLQWHHMISHTVDYPVTTVAGLEANTFADGLFHVFAYVMTIIGIVLIWPVVGDRTGPWSSRRFIGWVALGWALFNLVEGIIDHHILEVHHVRDDVADPLPWDLGFMAINVAILLIALQLLRTSTWEPSARNN